MKRKKTTKKKKIAERVAYNLRFSLIRLNYKAKMQLYEAKCTDPQMLDQKSNDWRSIFLWLNIVLNLKRK